MDISIKLPKNHTDRISEVQPLTAVCERYAISAQIATMISMTSSTNPVKKM